MNIDKDDIGGLKPYFFLLKIKEDLEKMNWFCRYCYKLKKILETYFDDYEDI